MVEIFTTSGISSNDANDPHIFLDSLGSFNKTTLSTVLGREGEALNYWVKRLLKSGEVVRIKRGLFVGRPFLLKMMGQPGLFDSYREYLAQVIRQPSYVSLEYVLARCGVIPEAPFAITSITTKSTRAFTNALGSFLFRNIKGSLFNGYGEEQFLDKRYYVATKAKALFDLVYLRKFSRANFEAEIAEGMRIDWGALKKSDLEELGAYAENSGSRKMADFVSVIAGRRLI